MTTVELVPLPWDSEVFGVPIARVEGCPEADTLAELARQASVDCAYLIVSPEDRDVVDAAEASRFQLVDTQVRFEAQLTELLPGRPSAAHDDVVVDAARPTDRRALQEIATELSAYSRFAADPRFGPDQARRLYDRWVDVSLEGRADLFLVARRAENVLGFITARTSTNSGSSLELVAVRQTVTGIGVGTTIVREAREGLAKRGVRSVSVVTQQRNTRAVGFYERCGFRRAATTRVYHRWFDRERLS